MVHKLKGSARDRLEFDLFMKQLEFGGKNVVVRLKRNESRRNTKAEGLT